MLSALHHRLCTVLQEESHLTQTMTPPTDSISAVNAWINSQCQSAAQWLVLTHHAAVRRAVSGWLRDSHLVDDVVQETFIKAFKAMHRMQGASHVEAWLCRIARNTCANAIRSAQRCMVRSATDCGIEDFSHMLATVDRSLSEDEESDRNVELLLSRLERRDRDLLMLVHFSGHSARDAGKRMGLSEGNVRIRMMRSHRALRNEALSMRASGLL
jgi:RNA polymerase sigma-70 factor, ECF subfamily